MFFFQRFSKVAVTYKIEFSDPFCSNKTAPPSVWVKVKRKSTALDVMEQAVDQFGAPYRFSATYFGTPLGYFIDSINGTASNLEDSCFWFFFVGTPDGKEFLSPVGVSNFRVPGKGYSIIWRFSQFEGDGDI